MCPASRFFWVTLLLVLEYWDSVRMLCAYGWCLGVRRCSLGGSGGVSWFLAVSWPVLVIDYTSVHSLVWYHNFLLFFFDYLWDIMISCSYFVVILSLCRGYFGVFMSLFAGAGVTSEISRFDALTVVLFCFLAIAYWFLAAVSRNYDIFWLHPCFSGGWLYFVYVFRLSWRGAVCLCLYCTVVASGGLRFSDVSLWRKAPMNRSRAKSYHYWLRSLSWYQWSLDPLLGAS